MRMLLKASVVAAGLFAIMFVVLSPRTLSSQTPAVYKAPRSSDGKPNFVLCRRIRKLYRRPHQTIPDAQALRNHFND